MKTLALLLALWALPSMADIRIDGDALVYDGPTSHASDAGAISALLGVHAEVRRIVLSGEFGVFRQALDVARVVDDFGLDTEVHGSCTEGCLYILAAGKTRTLAKGGLLHLRRIVVSADAISKQFDHLQASYGWKNEFAQAVFMYDRAQNDMRDALGFLLDHGVSLDFALQVFDMPRQDFWTPTREELVAGGVVGK